MLKDVDDSDEMSVADLNFCFFNLCEGRPLIPLLAMLDNDDNDDDVEKEDDEIETAGTIADESNEVMLGAATFCLGAVAMIDLTNDNTDSADLEVLFPEVLDRSSRFGFVVVRFRRPLQGLGGTLVMVVAVALMSTTDIPPSLKSFRISPKSPSFCFTFETILLHLMSFSLPLRSSNFALVVVFVFIVVSANCASDRGDSHVVS